MIDTTGMSLQQVSDAIAGKLIKQGGRCMGGDDECAYSDGKGKHCAVGWLLSESSPIMEFGYSMKDLVRSKYFKLEPNREFILDNVYALATIQDLHDEPSKHSRDNLSELVADVCELNMDAWSEWIEMG